MIWYTVMVVMGLPRGKKESTLIEQGKSKGIEIVVILVMVRWPGDITADKDHMIPSGKMLSGTADKGILTGAARPDHQQDPHPSAP
jgi:hypothetical protein